MAYHGVSDEMLERVKRAYALQKSGMKCYEALKKEGVTNATYHAGKLVLGLPNISRKKSSETSVVVKSPYKKRRPEPILSTIVAEGPVSETITRVNNDLFAVFFIRPDQVKQILSQL